MCLCLVNKSESEPKGALGAQMSVVKSDPRHVPREQTASSGGEELLMGGATVSPEVSSGTGAFLRLEPAASFEVHHGGGSRGPSWRRDDTRTLRCLLLLRSPSLFSTLVSIGRRRTELIP